LRRTVNGILLLDKPAGLTSNAVLQQVKHLYNADKAGHTGSLDPLATGLLPICFGNATKLSSYLLNADKSYHFVCRLGITTDTGDSEGRVTDTRPVGNYTLLQIHSVLKQFTGDIEQIPPMYSALKFQGKRLYDLARQGITVERQTRSVTIYELRLLSMTEDSLECMVRSSKGMYVRTLAEDIGEVLGCGGHVSALRRIGIKPYDVPHMISMDALHQQLEQNGVAALDQLLLPIDSALSFWPSVFLNSTETHHIYTGNSIPMNPSLDQSWVKLYGCDGQFIGIGESLPDGRLVPRRLFKDI
jgi:tRNA pseudouridine55 synthase